MMVLSFQREIIVWLSTDALAPSLRGLSKIGSSEPIFDWGSVFQVMHFSHDTPSVSLRLPPPSKREASGQRAGLESQTIICLSYPRKSPPGRIREGDVIFSEISRRNRWDSGSASSRCHGTYRSGHALRSSPAARGSWWDLRSRQPGRRGGGQR